MKIKNNSDPLRKMFKNQTNSLITHINMPICMPNLITLYATASKSVNFWRDTSIGNNVNFSDFSTKGKICLSQFTPFNEVECEKMFCKKIKFKI